METPQLNGANVNGENQQLNGTAVSSCKKLKTEHSNGHSYHANDKNGVRNTNEEPHFLQRVFDVLLQDAVLKPADRNSKVVDFVHPADLFKTLDLKLNDKGEDDDVIIKACQDTIKYSVKTGHPGFFNQLFGGFDQYGVAGAWLTETLNSSQYTFEVAPVFTLMEQVVLKKMRDLIGYTAGDGIFCPGGSVSNMYGLSLARYQKFPQVKLEGMCGLPPLCMFTSEQSHYSLKKGASFMGFGVKSLVVVKCDDDGKMIPSELEKAITQAKAEGRTPFFVNATAATTVLGAFDNLDEIADVCERHNLWMHVDACWGGGVLMSRKRRHLMSGVHRADSVSWNAHKMMGAPLQCSAFLTKHSGIMQETHSANARYLFQQDKFYDVSYDTGDKSIQCGRKIDVFKFWLMWKAKGNLGFEKEIDNSFENAEYLTAKIKSEAGFRLVAEPQCTNVCFWYIPPSLRGKPETAEWWEELGKVAPKIKERMVVEGSLLVGYNPLGDKVNFFRMVIPNLKLQKADMDLVIDVIKKLGADL